MLALPRDPTQKLNLNPASLQRLGLVLLLKQISCECNPDFLQADPPVAPTSIKKGLVDSDNKTYTLDQDIGTMLYDGEYFYTTESHFQPNYLQKPD